MDANRTRFWLLLGRGDWERCSDGEVELAVAWGGAPPSRPWIAWDGDAQEVTLAPRLYQFVPPGGDRQPSLESRRGADVDRFGNFYSIAPSGLSVSVASVGSGETAPFWPLPQPPAKPRPGGFAATRDPPPAPTLPLAGLAVTAHHHLLVGTLRPGGLLLFDLYAGGPPVRHLIWPEGVPFEPFDVAATKDGGAWILDRVHRRLWRLDATFSIVRAGADAVLAPAAPADFHPTGGAPAALPARTFPPGLALDASSPVDLVDPIAVAALPDGRALLLDRGAGQSAVRIYGLAGAVGAAAPLSLSGILEAGTPFSRAVVAQDFAVAADADPRSGLGRLIVASADGDQAFAFALSEDSTGVQVSPQPDYLPLRLFGGRALVARGNDVFYDFGDRFLPIVVARRPRYEREGTLRTFKLDGKLRGCVWHRLFIDACIPANTGVQVWTRAADDEKTVEAMEFTREPDPRMRPSGSEQPWVETRSDGYGTFELLFQALRGRYAQIELRLYGTGGATPRIRALRAYYPRFSYAERYLPSVYRQDAESYSFLDRFLANPEGVLTALEDRISAAQVLFDPRTAPAEALEWLGTWLGVVLDPAWDAERRRLFLRNAMDFFQWRGTARGVEMALRLALDRSPDESIFTETDLSRATYRIVERFRAARTPLPLLAGAASSGIRSVLLAQSWQPGQGGAALVKRWNNTLAAAGVGAPPGRFPVRLPADATVLTTWRSFCTAALGFVPRATGADLEAFQLFLYRRYKRAAALNQAWSTSYAGFADVPLFEDLPADGAPLADWYQFESVVLAMRSGAHAFDVYVTAPVNARAEDLQGRLDRAQRVVDAERPAHTTFAVKLYWALFRLGDVRLGADTLLDLGGRAPGLLPAMRLGEGYLAQGYLAGGPPQDAKGRRILGRDALGARFTRSTLS